MRGPSLIEQFGQQGSILKPVSIEGKLFPIPGQKSALVFWASWCGPCTVELKRIQSAINNKELKAENVFAINMGETQEVIDKVLQERKYTMPIVRDERGELSRLLKVEATPTIALIDEKGRIDWISSGLSPSLIYRLSSFLEK